MSYLRKSLCIVTGLVFAAIASIAMAAGGPQKTYSLLIQGDAADLANDPIAPPVHMTVYIKNESPPSTANSNIGSFTFALDGLTMLALAPGWSTAAGPSCPGKATCTLDTNTNTITVTNISSLQAQQIFPVTFTVSSCGEGNVPAATTLVYNGSGLTGQTFSPKADPNFFNAPQPGPVVASSSTQNVSCGSISCNDPTAAVPANMGAGDVCQVAPNSVDCVLRFRSINKDGFCTSADVGYTVTNNLASSDDTLHFEWFTEDAGAFAYKVNLSSNANPNFAWIVQNGQPVFIPADNCRGWPSSATSTTPPTDLLPHSITTLTSSVATTDNKIKVASTVGLSTGMDIVIGPYKDAQGNITIERMTVGNINANSNQVNVTRAVGGTSKSVHPSGAPVMTTPMNIFASNNGPYLKNDQRQMCIAVGPVPNGDGTFYIWVIDIGDGWSHP